MIGFTGSTAVAGVGNPDGGGDAKSIALQVAASIAQR